MDLINDDNLSNSDEIRADRPEDPPTTDEQRGYELNPEDNDDNNNETHDGSDTARVVDSATTYARECLRTENYTEATIALRSVLEISMPSTASYKMVVLHIAQLLTVSQQLKASIDCLVSVYRAMPPPLSAIDGICIIARSYEQLGSSNMARIWWKKLALSYSPNGLGFPAKPGTRLWEAMADHLFDCGLHVYAADFFGQAIAADFEKQFVPSNRYRYRYLVSLLAFVGPQGPTAHLNLCRSVAWSLAQWFPHRNGNAAHISTCYGDPHFYQMRSVYFTSFPAMYRLVFAWVDGPAGRIARCWRRHWNRLKSPPNPVSPDSSSSRAKRKENKKQPQHVTSPPRQPRTGLRGKMSAPSSTSPSPTRKPRTNDQNNHKTSRISHCKTSTIPGKRTEKNSGTKLQPALGLSNNAQPVEEFRGEQNESTTEKRQEGVKVRTAAKKPDEFCEHSSSKRKLGVVKRLRARRSSADPTLEWPVSGGIEKLSDDEEQTMTRSSSTSLLDLYPLQIRNNEDFVASCGREPGFADLDLNEVGEFARLAHYRARVLTRTHAPVNNLDTTKVKPQWLRDLEKAQMLIETHQQRNLTSGKVVVEGDSVAHLSEVHTRLVLQIATLCRQYTRDFGETSFTRRLRRITQKLVEWKFTRISEVVTALNDAKSIATQEEKQRNLEFYHVHHA